MDPIIKKCGNCAWSHPVSDVKMVACYGNPPQVYIVGGGQDQLGRVTYQVETLSPQVPKDRPPCRFHEPKFKAMDLSGLSSAVPVGNG